VAGIYRYTAAEGWSFHYPVHWDRLGRELGLVQDTAEEEYGAVVESFRLAGRTEVVP
jgi:hypothetical protein